MKYEKIKNISKMGKVLQAKTLVSFWKELICDGSFFVPLSTKTTLVCSGRCSIRIRRIRIRK